MKHKVIRLDNHSFPRYKHFFPQKRWRKYTNSGLFYMTLKGLRIYYNEIYLLTNLVEDSNQVEVVGGFVLRKKRTNMLLKPSWWLYHLFIVDSFKGKGLSKTLMSHCYDILRERNFTKIFLAVDKNNTIAINLYKKEKFTTISDTEDSYYMMRKIDLG